MIECVRRSARNVKRWQNGDKALRWTAAGMLEAERQFRRIIGHRDLAKLAVAVERDTARHHEPTAPPPNKETATLAPHNNHTGTADTKFHDEWDILS